MRNIKGDRVLWVVVVILSIFSLLAVYSSTGTLAYKKQGGNTEYYLFKHFVILAFGFFLMWLTHKVKYTYFSRISQLAMIVSLFLLALTLAFGSHINEASRSLTVPVINLTFQSSDFAKLALIMYTARMLSKKQDQIKDFKSAFLPIMWPIIAICALILPENFSTAAMLFATCLVLMFIGRVNMKYILSLIGTGLVTLVILTSIIYFTKPDKGRILTWKNRIENFVNGEKGGEDGYQVEQSKIAIATGGVFGKMPGKSTQRNFLPHPYSDFIFAIIIEEYGLFGGILLVLLYLIILFRGTRIVVKSPGNFGAFLAIGVSFSLVFQAMINMAVAVNLFPVTGQPMPFVSMGGTSIWFTSIAIGVILSVSRELENNPEKQAENGAVPA
ncbi:MAG: FtsW/RodA/SpoVE family cell cycle protein [Bacteroidetes bacterium]|nr:FtsW/RodA/SpoVE family cell cycle protein [Bacteroidota bacterium]